MVWKVAEAVRPPPKMKAAPEDAAAISKIGL
jgi:hypothetical protein